VLLIIALWPGAGFAEPPVDPNRVAAGFREVAEQRCAEQIKLSECTKKGP
jgi:hypothetical protein